MNLSDQIMLAKLRKYTRLTDSQWLELEAEVFKAGGILKSTGTAHSELMFCAGMARAEVTKHPGHADQAVHGNGGKNSKGGAAVGNVAAAQGVAAGFAGKTDDLSIGAARGATAIAETRDKSHASETLDAFTESAKAFSSMYGSNPEKQLGLLVGAKRAFDARFGGVDKSVEPVTNHPGHADQSVHGNGGKNSKGGAGSGGAAGGTSAGASEVNGRAKEMHSRMDEIEQMPKGDERNAALKTIAADAGKMGNDVFVGAERRNRAAGNKRTVKLNDQEMSDMRSAASIINRVDFEMGAKPPYLRQDSKIGEFKRILGEGGASVFTVDGLRELQTIRTL
jgi:hypothetical protein